MLNSDWSESADSSSIIEQLGQYLDYKSYINKLILAYHNFFGNSEAGSCMIHFCNIYLTFC